MTFATLSNFILMLLCLAVIAQSVRMAKSVREIRSSPLDKSVAQLDRATGHAQAVLNELKALLATDVLAQGRVISSAEALRDELSVMVGIGNAVAERIMEAAALQKEPKAQRPAKGEASARRQGSRKTRSRSASAKRKTPATAVVVTADTPVAGHA